MKLSGILVVVTTWFLFATPASAASVVNSVHNLSPTGPGTVRAAEDSGVCEFCHTSHMSSPVAALWNRRSAGSTYMPYSSSTAKASPGQPTGSSLLCLSCHDGTVALGDVLSRAAPISMAGGVTTMPPGRSNTTTDLRHHHPISFIYDSGLAGLQGELALPANLPPEIRMDSTGQMQCTSCHDPHDDSFGDFLVMPNQSSSLCLECHLKDGWPTTPHSQSGATWNGQLPDPWPVAQDQTVATNACRNCHENHQTGGGPNLLRNASRIDNCAACHNGNVASQDVMASFGKISTHPVASTADIHDPVESAVVIDRHVACSDCHNPHKPTPDQPGGGVRPAPQVRGVDLNNTEQSPATRVYQVCLRCHGDSPGKKTPLVRRQLDQDNVRAEIQPGNPSFHPVAGPGQNTDVPSLIPPWNEQSIMDCVDCHNSDSAVTQGGVKGPHGSSFEPILVRNYETTDFTRESPNSYALCYNCHNRNSILNDDSFGEHDKHISGEDSPCSACHDPHGISATQGNTTNNTHLINFDTTIVKPNSMGNLRFVDQGRFKGSCDLLCHGKNHRNKSY